MLRQLCSPNAAAKAVQSLKAQSISEAELVHLLEKLVKEVRRDQLPEPTLTWFRNRLALVSDPLVRHTCYKFLQSLSSTDHLVESLILGCIRTGEIELACSIKNQSKSHQLKSHRALYDKLAPMGILPVEPTQSQWLACFEHALSSEDYSLALYTWQLRSKFTNIPITTPLFHQFIVLAGRHQDQKTLKSVIREVAFDVSPSSATIAACLNCMASTTTVAELVSIIDKNTQTISQCNITDLRNLSDVLVDNILDVLDNVPEISTTMGNILLQGLYRNHTSQLVLHFYRRILKNRNFTSDHDTAQILANAAYRLGNSKVLIFEIWKEMNAMQLTRKFYETMLACQLVGTGCKSSKFVLAEMMRQKVPIRRHIQIMAYQRFKKLGDTTSLLDLSRAGFETRYTSFDSDQALAESGDPHLQIQAQANANMFKDGKDTDKDALEVLSQMLEFDKVRLMRSERSY